jgi:hypothetical protein
MDDQMMQRVNELRGYLAEALQHRDRETHFKIDEHGEICVSHPDEIKFIPMWIPGFPLCQLVKGRLLDRHDNDLDENDVEHLHSLLVGALDDRQHFIKGDDVTIRVINVPLRKP